jgi:hypothetical protein
MMRKTPKAPPKTDLARQRNNLNFFEDAFSSSSATGQPSPARARLHSDAIVMAEVKTNVIVCPPIPLPPPFPQAKK